MEWFQEFTAAIQIDQVALAGLVTLTVVLIIRGYLIPKIHLDDARTERDAWKTAYLESEKARGVVQAQNGELLEVAKTANHIIASLPGGDYRVGQTTQPTQTS